MSQEKKNIRIQSRVDSRENWENESSVPLLEREIGYEKETGLFKIGELDENGNEKHWNKLPYASSSVGKKTDIKNTTSGEIFNDYENNEAREQYSHAEGKGTVANIEAQHVQGKYNKYQDANGNPLNYAHVVGNGTGTANDKRKNAYTLDWEGNGEYSGNIKAVNGEFSGDVSATNGEFTGDISTTNGTISANKGVFTEVSAVNGAFTGNVEVTKGTISAAQGAFTGDISAVNGAFTGNVTNKLNDLITIPSDATSIFQAPYTVSTYIGTFECEYKGNIAELNEDGIGSLMIKVTPDTRRYVDELFDCNKYCIYITPDTMKMIEANTYDSFLESRITPLPNHKIYFGERKYSTETFPFIISVFYTGEKGVELQ